MAPPVIDAMEPFDRTSFSDITVKVADEEVKCHKIILCNASEYFRTKIQAIDQPGGESQAAEDQVGVLELDWSDPLTVSVMLDYLYDPSSYKSYEKDYTMWRLPGFHMEVHAVAEEYGISGLADEALRRLEESIEAIKTGGAADNGEGVVSVISCLLWHPECYEAVAASVEPLVNKHLFKLISECRDEIKDNHGLLEYISELPYRGCG
ncbi:hypothetical protein LTR37_007890 [Vermiconidia calcicola]|uniref:Uncharacterized protein n=1 Tax=Vermiconidia calcicola TaxID=1690605 RepID=A0ACC3NDH7_9PEZI|nr:hypothetical protein LTR37_007890 [Vermiconidia calcicola]